MRIWIAVLLGACGTAPTAPAITDLTPKPKPAIIDLEPSHAAITGLAVGARHTCALHADGTVSCWGANTGSQLGVAGSYDRSRPIRVPEIADAVELTADGDLTCVRRRTNSVTCWGELGAEDYDGAPRPLAFAAAIQISGHCVVTAQRGVECLRNGKIAPIGVSDVVQLSSRNDRGCALLRDGKVSCFYGNGVYRVPIANVQEVAVGNSIGCARMHSGAVRCWALAYGSEDIIVAATTIKDARSIVASDYEVCAIRRNGRVACDSPQDNRSLPDKALADLRGVSMLAVGRHACAIARGGLTCFGQNSDGELGIGWGRGQPTPILLPGIDDAVAVDTSAFNEQRTCVMRRGGGMTCFGQTASESNAGAIVRQVAVTEARAITATVYIGIVDRAGALWNASSHDKPERVPHMPAVRAVSGECAISTDNEMWCFGTMHPAKSDDAGAIPGAIDVVALSAPTVDHACYVRKTGAALCYAAPDSIVPLDIADARDISVGFTPENRRYSVCVLRADRTVACADDTDGSFAFAPLHDVDYLRDVRRVAVGGGFTCALRGDGTVNCWGDNGSGQLGDGTLSEHRSLPAPVVGIHDAIAITAGAAHACALHRDGTVSCWGEALVGQLGTFATAEIDEPQHLTAFTDL